MEHNPTPQENLKDAIMAKIKASDISMRPKFYFTLKIVALCIIALLVLLVSIFIVNFIVFSIRINSEDVFLGFGPRGFVAFARFFPWELLVLDMALIVTLGWMLRQFRFGYKSPALYLLAGLLLLVGVAGVVIDRGTDVNDQLLIRADQHRLPGPVGDFYGRARRAPPIGSGVCSCTIIAIDKNVLIVEDSRSTTTLTIILPLNDPRATTTQLKVGDRIFIAGDEEEGVIRAFGVRKMPSGEINRGFRL